jgi:dienelactone hydrolase
MRIAYASITLTLAALLAACGSDNDTPLTGALVEPASTSGVVTKDALGAASAPCDVTVVALNYTTPGARSGEVSNASAGLLVPTGADPACKGPFPLIAYARGTEVSKPRTMANPADPEMRGMAAAFAVRGYMVVATDYLGFAKSAYPYHPYLHADSEASAVVDSIRAARTYAGSNNLPLSGKVMLYGYSQGGHSSMATQRAIETSVGLSEEIRIAAAGHGAAPGALGTAMRTGAEVGGGQFFIPYLITAWQKVYGDAYSDVNAVFKAPYAGYIENLLPSATDTYTTLVTTGKLPPGPAYNDAMFQPAFIDSLKAGTSGVNRAAQRNDLVASGWNPVAPTRFCAGSGDPTVLYATSQKLAIDKWGAQPNVSSRDVDREVQAAAAAQNLDAAQTLAAYHGQLAPVVCLQDMAAFFETRR